MRTTVACLWLLVLCSVVECRLEPFALEPMAQLLAVLYGIEHPIITTTPVSGNVEISIEHSDNTNTDFHGDSQIEYRLAGCGELPAADMRFDTLSTASTVSASPAPSTELGYETKILNPLSTLAMIQGVVTDQDGAGAWLEMKYCLIFRLLTQNDVPANSRSVEITVSRDTATSAIAIVGSDEPTLSPIETTYEVKASPCNSGVTINQLDEVEICIEMDDGDYPAASIAGIESFEYTRTIGNTLISQFAYNGGEIQTLTSPGDTNPCVAASDLNSGSITGMEQCRFTTNMKADFFETSGQMKGSGVIVLLLGTTGRRLRAGVSFRSGTVSAELVLEVQANANDDDESSDDSSCRDGSILQLPLCWIAEFVRSVFFGILDLLGL